MIAWPPKQRLLTLLFWTACGLAVAGAVAALLLPLGGTNRIGIAALPFGIGAAAAAGLALRPSLDRRLVLVLYTIATLAVTYGLMMVGSVPLRLAVEGTCPISTKSCPIGFERPMSSGESAALDVAVAVGVASVFVILAALEVQFQPRLRVIGRGPAASSAPPPPPAMKPSAMVHKPAASEKDD